VPSIRVGRLWPVTRKTSPDPVRDRSNRLSGKSAFRLHLTLTLGLALCAFAFAFELSRALGGHTFSWMYVFEWPLFAGFAIYMWWNLFNGYDRQRRPERRKAESDGISEPDGTDGLEAWNRYLQAMDAAEAEASSDSWSSDS
jgi:hypothetical protein